MWRILIRLSREFYNQTEITSAPELDSADLTSFCYQHKHALCSVALKAVTQYRIILILLLSLSNTLKIKEIKLIQAADGSHLELRDHSDFIEPLGGWVLLGFFASEDLVQQGGFRLLKQGDKLWWQWIL